MKKVWDYIKANKLQSEANKIIIECDELFKNLCDGEETVHSFKMQKYITRCIESIPKNEQAEYKEILRKRGERENGSPA